MGRATPEAVLGAVAGSALAVLAGAFAFQHVGGLDPCPLCIWQRWPYAIGAAVLLIALWLRPPAAAAAALLAGLIFAGGAGLSAWHAGIEWGWWTGPAACAGRMDPATLSAAELLQRLEATAAVRCDAAPWRLGGLSLAGWSAVILAGLGATTVLAARRLAQGSSSTSQ